MAEDSKITVVAALAANAAIATVKFIVAAITGSAAMTAEGIHSLVDTGDAMLLLVGKRLAGRGADPRHPFGHGKELYFWSLIVAMVVFGAGGCVSIYEGIHRLVSPHPLEPSGWTFAVLGVAFVLEGTSFFVAVRTFLAYRRRRLSRYSFFGAIRAAKDPTVFSIVLEDAAALVGIIVAFAGVTLATVLRQPAFDAASSIVIGLLLAGIAFVLGSECRGLLIGERALPDVLEKIRALVERQPGVERLDRVRTMHLGPEEVWVELELRFAEAGSAASAAAALGAALRARFPEVAWVSIDTRSFGT